LDRGRETHNGSRRESPCGTVRNRTTTAMFRPCGLVFELAFETAHFAVSQQPLAFTIAGSLHGCAAGVAAIAGRGPRRVPHGLVTSGAIAKNRGMPFCCATTRGLGSGARGRHVDLRRLLPAALAFCLGMPLTPQRTGTESMLPLRPLPAMHSLQTFRLAAVALVVRPGLKSPLAAFAETNAPSQPPAPGGHTVLVAMLNLSHGRLRLPGAARGGSDLSSSGTLPSIHCAILWPSDDSISTASSGNRTEEKDQDGQDLTMRQAVPRRRKRGRKRNR